MAVDQLPGRMREFASYLNGLLARLDQGDGWCGVFWQRDPDGMRACRDGREVPPWDVVEALLRDLAAAYGPATAAREAERARPLHGAALDAYDARPGGRDALGDRLDVMLREKRYAAERTTDLRRRLEAAANREQAESLRLDLAWAQDDHQRATARCAELRRRMEALDHHALRSPAQGVVASGTPRAGDVRGTGPRPEVPRPGARPAGAPTAPHAPASGEPARGREPSAEASVSPARSPEPPAPSPEPPAPSPEPPARQRSKRRPRGSARFAGAMDVPDVPPADAPAPAPAPAPSRRSLRGARFAGAAAEEPQTAPQPRREASDEADRRITADTVATLARLRAQGRSGEAHALLVEAAQWPAARYPLLAAELHRAGLDADWATLLWEAASMTVDRLVAASDALIAAGRTADGEQMLRQGVLRPADEIGAAVLGLDADGRHREVRALLDAYVRIRPPEEAARSAVADPQRLVPLLLEAARGVSDERHWDLVHALRVAGFTA
ncbi:hypothetical protein [Streptomyces sp. TP-A0356]|uniref:hypothetical protein n=1 Tax=Streptomyces sp. TP-A0356 TaxID=1359208 RepID=UPI0006E46C39|nr:hypothetical protein [Streptomyces sp. TP-A0356]